MKHLHLFESYEYFEKFKRMIDRGTTDYSGFNTKEDAIEELDYLFNTDFPYGFKNIPEIVTLYRVLLINKETNIIKEENVGDHYISVNNEIGRGFLEKIGIWDDWDEDEEKLILLECKTTKNNIDIDASVGNRLAFPRENEFTVIDGSKVKIIGKKEIKKEEIDQGL